MYKRLQPILFVEDLKSEVEFYQKLGFQIEHEEVGFVGLAYQDHLLFGLQQQAGSIFHETQPLIWQIATDHIESVYQHCQQAQFKLCKELELQPWGEWLFGVLSPNGYQVLFEGTKNEIG